MIVGFAYGYTMTPEMSRWQKIVMRVADQLPSGAVESGAIFTKMLMEHRLHTERGVGARLATGPGRESPATTYSYWN